MLAGILLLVFGQWPKLRQKLLCQAVVSILLSKKRKLECSSWPQAPGSPAVGRVIIPSESAVLLQCCQFKGRTKLRPCTEAARPMQAADESLRKA